MKFGVVSSESFAITFNKFYISTCILNSKSIMKYSNPNALAVVEIVKTLSVALEVSLRLMCGHFDFFFAWSGKYITRPKVVYKQHFGYFIFKILNHAQIRIARP